MAMLAWVISVGEACLVISVCVSPVGEARLVMLDGVRPMGKAYLVMLSWVRIPFRRSRLCLGHVVLVESLMENSRITSL